MPQTSTYQLPKSIASLAGKIIDVDMHECIPINMWVDEFGAIAKPIVDAYRKTTITMVEKTKDDTEINAHTVWNTKLENAPGGIDLTRRLEVLDFMGVDRALVYPGGVAMTSVALYASEDRHTFLKGLEVDNRPAYGRQLQSAYNEWCVRVSRGSDRLRPVAILIADTPEALYAQAKALVSKGVRGIWFPSGILLAGLSPAHPAHDPLWAMLASADCPVLAHVGGQHGFFATEAWRKAPAFEGWNLGGEFTMDPWVLSTQHFAVQSYVTAMVLGGVFERHPTLRFGTAEYTGHWVGPMAENMDRWIANKPFRSSRGEKVLSMKPSDYVRRNIRIGCFDFEPMEQYIRNFGFEEIYCYSSDFPHNAGGQNPIGISEQNIGALGAEMLQRFFVDNGRFLLPN